VRRKAGNPKIAVVGLGKIGLPLAVQFASSHFNVVGFDVLPSVVHSINEAIEPFPGEKDLDWKLRKAVRRGRLRATSNPSEAIAGAELVAVAVPLYIDQSNNPDFSAVENAMRSIGRHMSHGVVVSLETTVPVGTTRGLVTRWLSESSGLIPEEDFFVVFSPERVFSGRVFSDLRRYPKIVGGVSSKGAEKAAEFYRSAIKFDSRADLSKANGVWVVSSAEAAELLKLAETTYRDVNIGLANQFAVFAENSGIDIQEVISAANTHPYSHIHQPGIAVGGHCIPVYPQLYLSGDPKASIVREAREVNLLTPERCVQVVEKHLGSLQGVVAVVFGATYRGGVKETAFSGVFPIVNSLQARGAKVRVHDNILTNEELVTQGLEPYEFGGAVDLAIVHSDDQAYQSLSKEDCPGIRLIFDGRNVTDGSLWADVTRLVIGVGNPENLATINDRK